jgi:hypothetical protein
MLEWLFAGGVFGASHKCRKYVSNSKEKRKGDLYHSLLIDQELERKLWRDVCDQDKLDEVWNRIEQFKRDNPVICAQDDTNHWGYVGKHRFRTTYARGERHAKKRDEELRIARSMTVDLLAMTYGKHSQSQASIISSRGYCGIVEKI